MATADSTTLVVKASKDSKLHVTSTSFVEGEATILDGERLGRLFRALLVKQMSLAAFRGQ